ncbi:MAG TPA: VPLPA-CTERM sorting domain-containing protein [Steroidobacteraceae bacterium]|nr:VPLPA-CTERM sorting domain-containing protein [Steroidobacteraceae bacterium]
MSKQLETARHARRTVAALILASCAAASMQTARAQSPRAARGQHVVRSTAELVTALTSTPATAISRPTISDVGTGDSLLVSKSDPFSVSESVEYSASVPGPGDLIVQLSSINVGSFVDANLSLNVDSATSLLEGASGVTGTDLLSPLPVSGPETVFFNLTGQATGSLDVGLYSLNVVFEPSTVPLPRSAWLLLAGLAGIGGLLRFKAALPRAA